MLKRPLKPILSAKSLLISFITKKVIKCSLYWDTTLRSHLKNKKKRWFWDTFATKRKTHFASWHFLKRNVTKGRKRKKSFIIMSRSYFGYPVCMYKHTKKVKVINFLLPFFGVYSRIDFEQQGTKFKFHFKVQS